MVLSRSALTQIHNQEVEKPAENLFHLPEKILQFGTGVLLRGLCDYFVHQANSNGKFNGRIVVVKSTSAGEFDAFHRQDNLYTICIRGVNEGNVIKRNVISSAISRVISAANNWQQVLDLARSPGIQIIISNTTEVGLQLVNESIHSKPPVSYPAKLLAFLYSRYQHFGNSGAGKLVVIPTELITGNGNKLRSIIESLSSFNNLGEPFNEWMRNHVHFCNSLVDRIVTKDPGEKLVKELQAELGYDDDLLTMCEDYCLWAIEGDEQVRSVLTFASEEGVFVEPDIEIFKSLKLHLLNGTHTLSASFAYLCGYNTVKEAMQQPSFRNFVEQLMLGDISPNIPYPIAEDEKLKFGNKVLDRFSNPFLQHQWLNITLQQTTKMRMRNLPILLQHQQKNSVPGKMATGFAAYLLFMKAVKVENGTYYGSRNGEFYPINDDHAPFFYELWKRTTDTQTLVQQVLANQTFWEHDLSTFTSFKNEVVNKLNQMQEEGVRSLLLTTTV